MTKKLTPAEAWSHVKALWPDATSIVRKDAMLKNDMVVTIKGSIGDAIALKLVDIDWPEGITQWPPIEEWRDAVWPQDWGKGARFRDSESYSWRKGFLGGLNPVNPERVYKWWGGDIGVFKECQVRVTDGDKAEKSDSQNVGDCAQVPTNGDGHLLERDFLSKEQIAEFLCSDEFMRRFVDTALATPLDQYKFCGESSPPITRPATAE